MNDIILNDLKKLQNEYLELLKKIQSNMDNKLHLIIDEIILFWTQRRKFVLFLMENYFPPQNTFLFTAATFLDYDSKEHFPFAVCPGTCIIDDTVCYYGHMIEKIKDDAIIKTTQEQLKYAIDDNIKVLENCSEYIYILPLCFLDNDESDLILKGAESAFLNMFEPSFSTMNDYFQYVLSIEDLEKKLKQNIEHTLMFSDNDNKELSLSERIEHYIIDDENVVPIKSETPGVIFYYAVFSQILQSLRIIMWCAKYNIIPYIRNDTAFHYFNNLIYNFPDRELGKIIQNKTCTCYLIHKTFDIDKVEFSNFPEFVVKAHTTKLYEQVYHKFSNWSPNTELKEIGDYAYEQINIIIDSFK